MKEIPDNASAQTLTPAMEQWRQVKSQHPDKLVFFRMGDFYELFFDDAVTASRLLDLTLTSRTKGENPIPMAGVPYHACARYLRDLLAKGQKVVIVDQLEDPKQAKGLVKRGVTRVITPGTVLEDECLAGRANNFLAACALSDSEAGAACLDLSTGEFLVFTADSRRLADEISRYAPAEILLAKGGVRPPAFAAALNESAAAATVTERETHFFDPHLAADLLKRCFQVATLDGFGLGDAPLAIAAAGALLRYVEETQNRLPSHLKTPRRLQRERVLILDRATQRNLEILEPLRGNDRRATLIAVLDQTATAAGSRRLRRWLLEPLLDLEELRLRQEAVAELMQSHTMRADLRQRLAEIADLERIVARISAQRANARDLAALGRSISQLPALAAMGRQMASRFLRSLFADLDPLTDIGDTIAAALADDPPAALLEGGLIRDGFCAELDELRAISRGGKEWLARFQAEEQERTRIPSLKVGFNRVFGYYIEITHTHKDKVPPEYERKQTLVNAERYITPQLKEYEQKVLGAEEKSRALEYEIFCRLRADIAGHGRRIQETADRLATVDALAALAEVSVKRGYVMPELHDGLETAIKDGRHPVVEALLRPGEFVPNDLEMHAETSRILIITGPNMAGKSTYIRQVAILFIMAQMGCAIPAAAARIGLADRIFSRVGAADDLARGQSTFMVEMAETANILNNATERSLVILDEVGRGTSTFDGVSLAWAITEYLHHRVRARVLFATHYHELAELGAILPGIKNYNVAVREWGGEILFLRRIHPGSCDRSYGIQVARLAGIPPAVIARSREILAGLEAQAAERDNSYVRDSEVLRAAARAVQLDLFASQAQGNAEARQNLLAEIASIDPDNLSPREAHERLRALVEKAKRI